MAVAEQTPWGLKIGRELKPWPEQGHTDPLQHGRLCPGQKMPLVSGETYLTIAGGIDESDGHPVEVRLLGADVVHEGTCHEFTRLIMEDAEKNVWWISEARFHSESRRGKCT